MDFVELEFPKILFMPEPKSTGGFYSDSKPWEHIEATGYFQIPTSPTDGEDDKKIISATPTLQSSDIPITQKNEMGKDVISKLPSDEAFKDYVQAYHMMFNSYKEDYVENHFILVRKRKKEIENERSR